MLLNDKHIFNIKGQFIFIGLISLLFISGCNDDPVDFGENILPGKTFLQAHGYNGHHLTTYNVTKDSVRTDDPAYGILGYFKDPLFGVSRADLMFQVSPGVALTDSAFNMGEDYFIDSLVFTLNYQFNWWYGDMLAKHLISIYELQADLLPHPYKYYSNVDVSGYYDPSRPVAQRESFVNDDVNDTLWIKTVDEMWADPDSLWSDPSYLWNTSDNPFEQHYWTFKLNDDIAEKVFNLDSATLANASQFKQILKGFYISSELLDDASQGSLVRLDMLGGRTDLKLYYSHYVRNEDGEITDTLQKIHIFPINVEAVRVNRFFHDFEDKIVFNDPDNEHLYVQGMAGSYAKIVFPENLYNWKDSIDNVDENGNEFHCRFSTVDLLIYVDSLITNVDRYPPPRSLNIYVPKMDSLGNYLDENDNIVDRSRMVLQRPYYLDKYGQFQYAFSEGLYEPNLKLYYFNIKVDFLEFIIRRKEEDGVELLKDVYVAPDNPEGNFQRVVLFSSEAEKDSILFNIGYVKYY
ncbi:MAG: DUF4270 domain-containing protein [Chlorobi bacterium]|nr:DUF4270 domain-containing protein [Chlorobiota bacterium]